MTKPTAKDVEQQFAAALLAKDFGDHSIPADGEWHNFAFPDSKNGKKNGSALLTHGDSPNGVVLDKRRGDKPIFRWTPNGAKPQSTAKTEAQNVAKVKSLNLFSRLPKAPADHPYLLRKGIKNPTPLKIDEGSLVVPIYDATTGKFQAIQRIWPDGKKSFPKDSVLGGCCAMPGSRELDDLNRNKARDPVVIAEGYATAATIRAATLLPTLAAMNCGNLKAVGLAMRKRFPLREIIFAADNDEKTDGNPGVTHANAAARLINAKVATPPPGDFADLLATSGELAVESMIKRAVEPPKRPTIRVTAGELSTTATRAEKLLQDAGQNIFQRAGTLVRPIVEEVDAAHGRKTKVAQFSRVDATYLRDVLGREADWLKTTKNGDARLDPPLEVALTILSRVGEWKFPAIAGVITTPTMRPDGTILDQPGYDPATRLLLIDPPPMPAIPDNPTREDALVALELLENLLVEFPFADAVARAVALSGLITPVVRGAFPVAPMHATSAPVAGTGKSYLGDVQSNIATGQAMPVMAAGRNEEETEKRLGAALLTGQPLISIDNVNGELGGDALCQIIERPIVEVRILGKSERVRIEARGTTMFCNGNNIVLVGDVCRRVITATLDPQVERPELREFKNNPVATVLADRGAYIAAALTMCRAYMVAGRPNRAAPLASFEGWSDCVRSALTWLGKADPVESMEMARAEDPELGALRDMLNAWAVEIGTGGKYRKTLKQVIEMIGEIRPNIMASGPVAPTHPLIFAAVHGVAGGRGQPDAKRLGNWMRRFKNRLVGDLRLASKPDVKGGAEWWVEHRAGTEIPPKEAI